MEKGDISNRIAPRWLFQFEHIIAKPPSGVQSWWQVVRTAGRGNGKWQRLLRDWEVDEHSVKVLWDLYWRQDARFDVVAFELPIEAHAAVVAKLEEYGLPVGNVYCYSPDELAQRLATMIDVQRVIHSLPDGILKFGGRGIYVARGEKVVLY